MTVDIFDMSNVIMFKGIEMEIMEDVIALLCLRSVELSKVFGLRKLCYSKISVVMLLGYRIAGISRKLESERKTYALRPNAAYLNSLCQTCLVQKNETCTVVEFS